MSEGKLSRRIERLIAEQGPLPLSDFMSLCALDPVDGYYARCDSIGSSGDFVTAPEISQVFGELLGVWCVACWRALGSPVPFVLAEAGAGNGTMMSDLLRAAIRLDSEMIDSARIRLIESSARMRERQASRLETCAVDLDWIDSLDELPDGIPLILVANEFLDALPVRQFVKSGGAWRERCVTLDSDGKRIWTLGLSSTCPFPPSSSTSSLSASSPDGAIFERSPAREAWASRLAERIAHDAGAALLIDYGHSESGLGDTFQAVRGHRFADPLSSPGLCDLTAHVDFSALAGAIREAGGAVSELSTQGDFLRAMGLRERIETLGEGKDSAERKSLRLGAERLAGSGSEAMGESFKVLGVCSADSLDSLSGLPPFG